MYKVCSHSVALLALKVCIYVKAFQIVILMCFVPGVGGNSMKLMSRRLRQNMLI